MRLAWPASEAELGRKRVADARAREVIARLGVEEVAAVRAALERAKTDGEPELARALAPLARSDPDDNVVRWACFMLHNELWDHITVWDLSVACARWGALDLPTVHVSGTQAAALMLSDLSAEQLAELEPRWRSFRIRLEEPLFVPELGEAFHSVHVQSFATSLHSVAELEDDTFLYPPLFAIWVFGQERRYFAQGWTAAILYETHVLDPVFSHHAHTSVAPAPADERTLTMLGRLALNLCQAIQSDAAGLSFAPLRPHARRRKGEKRRRVFGAHRLDLDLVWNPGVDVRGHVADYLSGDAPTYRKLRWVVRGHWKNQPRGKDRAERRRIWIAPHVKHRRPELLKKPDR